MQRLFTLLGLELNEVSGKEKVVSAVGGLLAIMALTWVTHHYLESPGSVCVIASMGASAVLLFAVPHGQLSQPWPVLAGHGFSAIIGVTCARYLGHGWLAAGCAVGLSILVMHHLKCIHPPGGATALSAILGGPAIHALGYHFVWLPVMLNALIMVTIAVIYNWPFRWRRYPAAWAHAKHEDKPHPFGRETEHEDIVKALQSVDSFVDVTEADLRTLATLIAREREARLLKEGRNRRP